MKTPVYYGELLRKLQFLHRLQFSANFLHKLRFLYIFKIDDTSNEILRFLSFRAFSEPEML